MNQISKSMYYFIKIGYKFKIKSIAMHCTAVFAGIHGALPSAKSHLCFASENATVFTVSFLKRNSE